MLELFEIIILLFCAFAFSRVLLRLYHKQVTWREGAFWMTIWVFVVLLVLFQNMIGLFSRYIEGRRPVDVIMYISILLLFYLVFRLYVKLDALNSEITLLVRQQTLLKRK